MNTPNNKDRGNSAENATVFDNRRILVIDDQESIQRDFAKILGSEPSATEDLANAAMDFFGGASTKTATARATFEIDSALQGQAGFELACKAKAEGRPYAVAFVDMRMPPGWDGIETIAHLWDKCPDVQVVICTAYSDYSWEEIVERLGHTDRLVILKKPFDNIEVRQLAEALTTKWSLARQAELKLTDIAEIVNQKTSEIELARQDLVTMNGKLAEAKAVADAANRSKSEFLANMSHEIRTPMTAILGYADVLKSERIVDESSLGSEALDTIVRNGEHLLNIINDILDLSKVEAGKLETEHIRCSATDIVQHVTSLMKGRASEKSLGLNVEYKTPVPETIITDPTRLRQILTNMVGNAVKFTKSGSVRIELSLPDGRSSTELFIDVIDTGIGMTQQQLGKLFQPFSQADGTTTRNFGGTGLGLVISKRFAELLRGDLTITASQPNVGTTFRLTIATGPLDNVRMLTSPSDSNAAVVATHQPNPPAVESISSHILLAEDGLDNQRLIAHLLKRAGATVSVVENGKLAVETAMMEEIGNHPFDIILMDMQMPEMDGYDATRELRARGYQKPIIAVTAHAMAGDKKKCQDAGCDAYMPKPIDRGKLISLIRKISAEQALSTV